MTSTRSLQPELGLIYADAVAFRNLLGRPEQERALLLLPHLSMFAVESHRVLKRRGEAGNSFGQHEGTIREARHAMKFLDDTRGAAAVLARYRSAGVAADRIFVRTHRGFLAPLKRWLQSDLGVFVGGGAILGTTDSMLTYIGLSSRALAVITPDAFKEAEEATRARAHALGAFVGAVLAAFGDTSVPRHQSFVVRAVDVKAREFYGPLLRAPSPEGYGLAALIAALLGATNVVYRLLPATLAADDPLHRWIIAKWRLVSLFHVASSLTRITATLDARERLRPGVNEELVSLRRRVKGIRSMKRLRDALVHYEVGGASLPDASLILRLGRISARPIGEVETSVVSALSDISQTLARWFPRVQAHAKMWSSVGTSR